MGYPPIFIFSRLVSSTISSIVSLIVMKGSGWKAVHQISSLILKKDHLCRGGHYLSSDFILVPSVAVILIILLSMVMIELIIKSVIIIAVTRSLFCVPILFL